MTGILDPSHAYNNGRNCEPVSADPSKQPDSHVLTFNYLQELFGVDHSAAELERSCLSPAIRKIEHFSDVAMEYQSRAKPGMTAAKTRAVIIMVGTTEVVTYTLARKPKSFSDIGQSRAPETPARVLPFTVPFARSTRKVLPKYDEDAPF